MGSSLIAGCPCQDVPREVIIPIRRRVFGISETRGETNSSFYNH